MIRWPWTSRARLDDAHEQVAALRAQVEKLQDQLTRVVRVQQGMTEAPREVKPRDEPMPQELLDYIRGFGDIRIRNAQVRDLTNRYRRGTPWRTILAELHEERDGGTTPQQPE